MVVTAILGQNVIRVTVDLEVGSYARISSLLDAHNARLQPKDPRLTRTKLVRSLIGSWVAEQERIAAGGVGVGSGGYNGHGGNGRGAFAKTTSVVSAHGRVFH